MNIFLVHAHSDRESIHKLYTRLIKDGINAWLDVENLQPGQDWQHEIAWMSLYFSVAVWLSIALVHAPVPARRAAGSPPNVTSRI